MNKSYTVEYKTLHRVIDHCYNANSHVYKYYGARGITVCERWLDRKTGYDNFLADMGKRPEGCSIDRIDCDGDYCPENCRWASKTEQAHNRRPYGGSNSNTGIQGVRTEKRHKNGKTNFVARITKNGVHYVKRFDTLEEARKWRVAKERELYN